MVGATTSHKRKVNFNCIVIYTKRLRSSTDLDTDSSQKYKTTTVFQISTLPDTGESIKNVPSTLFKVLLDTGSTSSIVSKKVSKYGTKIPRRNSTAVEWSTANSSFYTTNQTKLIFKLPELSTKKKLFMTST